MSLILNVYVESKLLAEQTNCGAVTTIDCKEVYCLNVFKYIITKVKQ